MTYGPPQSPTHGAEHKTKPHAHSKSAELEPTFKDWEFGLVARTKKSGTGGEYLTSEIVQAWDDMNVAWSKIKDHSGNVPKDALQQFRDANQRFQDVWNAMIVSD